MSDPSCRTFRELLGVYVVGAIEPGERAAVDAHLMQCYECREELAGLAPLTALLHRVPAAEAERIAQAGTGLAGTGQAGTAEGDVGEPSPELLGSLLRQVSTRRRSRWLRGMFAAAAALLIAVAGTAAVVESGAPSRTYRTPDVATASRGVLGVTVRYGKTTWGTTMSVRVTGFREWTTCKFWVITKDGRRELAGGWIVGPGAGRLWYPVDAGVPEASVAGFQITWGHRGALQIPAA